MQEIEYKFLVDHDKWAKVVKPEPETIVQGFLVKSEDVVVRVRIKGAKGFITIKGRTVGITRTEFEYEIPLNEAEEMLDRLIEKKIIKKRYEIPYNGKIWEVDVFEGKLSGLILAELEVNNESEVFDIPDWVTDDVSSDPRYYNAVLIDRC